MARALTVGDLAPDFDAEAQDGRRVRLADVEARFLVLYFYPKSFTPICTRQAQGFRDRHGELIALGAEVVGVSGDSVATQCDFAAHHSLSFPVVSDADGEIASAYGVRRMLLGGSRRMTFVIDSDRRIVARFHHELSAARHVQDVLSFLESNR